MGVLTDSHAHLDFPEFDADRAEVVARAARAGVTRIITIGTDPAGSGRALSLSDGLDGVRATVGLHPCYVGGAAGDWRDGIARLARDPRVVAIGEIGLDHHHLPPDDPERRERLIATQREAFRWQLELAAGLGLNVVVHQRDAWRETLDILTPFTGRLRAVFHCFGGTPEQVAELQEMGHLVSFTGIVTFRNAAQVRESAAAAREYLVETDCPYLAPVPHRGRRCEPAYVVEVARAVAAARGESLERVAAETEETAQKFFAFARG